MKRTPSKEKERSPSYRTFKSHYWHLLPDVPSFLELSLFKDPDIASTDIVEIFSVSIQSENHGHLLPGCDQILIVLLANGNLIGINLSDIKHPEVTFHIKLVLPKSCYFKQEKLPPDKPPLDLVAHGAMNHRDLKLYLSLGDDQAGIFCVNLVKIMEKFLKSKPNFVPSVVLHHFVRGTGNRRFEGIAVDVNAETLFCCDSKSHRAVRQWSLLDGRELPEIYLPQGLKFAPYKVATTQALSSETLYRYMAVTDKLNSHILIFTLGGEITRFSHAVASYGKKLGEVNSPRHVQFDAAGNLFVNDYGNMRIQMFSRKKSLRQPTQVSFSDLSNESLRKDGNNSEKVVWSYEVGERFRPAAVTFLLTSDANPRPIVCMAYFNKYANEFDENKNISLQHKLEKLDDKLTDKFKRRWFIATFTCKTK